MIQLDLKKAKNDASKPEKVTSLETLSDTAEDELNLMKTRFSFHKSEIKNCFIRSVGWGVLAAVLTLLGIAMVSGSLMNSGQQAAQSAYDSYMNPDLSESSELNARISSGKYSGAYVSDETWEAMYYGDFNPTILLREDGTCQIPYKYAAYALSHIDANYTVNGNTLQVTWDGYNGWEDGHNEVSGEILDDGIMWQGIYLKKQ